jgi:hypothetical protein
MTLHSYPWPRLTMADPPTGRQKAETPGRTNGRHAGRLSEGRRQVDAPGRVALNVTGAFLRQSATRVVRCDPGPVGGAWSANTPWRVGCVALINDQRHLYICTT